MLVIAKRELSHEEYDEFHKDYKTASESLHDREVKVHRAIAAIETNLELLGATAVEDKLQDGVPDTLEALRTAGIKVKINDMPQKIYFGNLLSIF